MNALLRETLSNSSKDCVDPLSFSSVNINIVYGTCENDVLAGSEQLHTPCI